jgi:hypothetical protein
LKLRQGRLCHIFFIVISTIYAKTAYGSPTVSEAHRSHRPARTVNRNEPFGSILERANSHFSKPLTFFDPVSRGMAAAEIGFQLRNRQPERFASRVAPHGYDVAFMPMSKSLLWLDHAISGAAS